MPGLYALYLLGAVSGIASSHGNRFRDFYRCLHVETPESFRLMPRSSSTPKNDFVYPNCLVITSDVLFSGQGTLRIHSLRLRSKGKRFLTSRRSPTRVDRCSRQRWGESRFGWAGIDGALECDSHVRGMDPWSRTSYSFQSHQDPCRVVSHTLPAWFASRKTWVYGDSNYCVL